MYIIMSDGSAIDDETGNEIYVNYRNGLYRVYFNTKVIAAFHSGSAAADFIEKHVAELNGVDK